MQSVKNASPVEETLRKGSNTSSVTESFEFLSTKSNMITEIGNPAAEIDIALQNAKYFRNLENMIEIILCTNIGFVTIALRTEYKQNRSGNEHRCKGLSM